MQGSYLYFLWSMQKFCLLESWTESGLTAYLPPPAGWPWFCGCGGMATMTSFGLA
jgi:hypothetical protein